MNRIYILILFGVLCNLAVFCQNKYRVLEYNSTDSKESFIVPPKTSFKFKHNQIKHQYYYVLFKGLDKDYYKVINNLNNAFYWSGNSDYFNHTSELFNTSQYKICFNDKDLQPSKDLKGQNEYKVLEKILYKSAPLDQQNSIYFIQFYFANILLGQNSEIESNFLNISKKILSEISDKEGHGIGKYNWPISICQNIVEKIFDLIPIPIQISLTRYICEIDNNKSFILLNSKIKLKVDAVEKVKNGSNWYFNLIGTTLITLTRNNEGQIIQNPFHKFQVKGMPDNTAVNNPDAEPDIVHQASTEDIQLSETLRDKPYIFLYQNGFKASIVTSLNKVCAGTSEDRFDCNTMLVHYSDLSKFFNNRNKDLSLTDANYISSFGFRNLITPIIDITVNGNLIQCPIGLSINQLRNQIAIPLSFKIYRFWNGKYTKFKYINIENLILLPNDKIIF